MFIKKEKEESIIGDYILRIPDYQRGYAWDKEQWKELVDDIDALSMAEEAGNEYMNLAIEGISITVLATQQSYESDSFDKWYDKNATFPNVSAPVSIPEEDVAAPLVLTKNGMTVEIPAGVVNDLPADVESVQLIYDAPVVKNNEVHFGYVELVDQNGEKIDLSNNTKAIGNGTNTFSTLQEAVALSRQDSYPKYRYP